MLMKFNFYIISAITFTLVSACSSSYQYSSGVYDDDLYYNAKDKPVTVAESYSPLPKPDSEIKKEENLNYSQLQNEYYSSDRAEENEDLRDFSTIQNEYASILSNDSIQEVDSLLYYDDNTGYWVNEFNGSEQDKDYAERIARFHGPMVGIPYWSPLYNDVIFNSGFNYNVYVDGDYAYVTPDWTNRYYNNWRYGPTSSWGFYGGYNYGWGYPGYGYGYPNYAWGYPGYGMGYPGYGMGYPGYGMGYPGYGWGHPYPPMYGGGSNLVARERSPRYSSGSDHGSRTTGSTATRGNRVATTSNSTRTSTSASSRATRSSSTQQTRQSTTTTGRATRASYTPASSITRTSNTSGNSSKARVGYTPTYTRSSSTNSRNTRNSYNTRSSKSQNTRTTSTRSNNSSRQSNSDYNTGSSNNYQPSRSSRSSNSSSSNSNSSYSSPSRSSSYSSPSRSSYSGSSSRSSGGSSGSSRRSR